MRITPETFRAVGVPEYTIGAKHTKYNFALIIEVKELVPFGLVADVWLPDTNETREVPYVDLRKWGFKRHKNHD